MGSATRTGSPADSGLNKQSLYFHGARSLTASSCCGWFLCSTMSSRTRARCSLMLRYAWCVGFSCSWLDLMVRLLPLLRRTSPYLRWEEIQGWQQLSSGDCLWKPPSSAHFGATTWIKGPLQALSEAEKEIPGFPVSVVGDDKERAGRVWVANRKASPQIKNMCSVNVYWWKFIFWSGSLLIFRKLIIVVTNRYWVHLLLALGTMPSTLYEFSHSLFAIPMTEVASVCFTYEEMESQNT